MPAGYVVTNRVAARRSHLSRFLGIILGALIGVSGCGPMMGLRKDLERVEAALREVSGTISAPSPTDPIVLVVLKSPDDVEAARVFSGTRPGAFSAYLPKEPLYLFAFADHNQDLRLDPGEASAWYRAGQPLAMDTNHFELELKPEPAQPVPGPLRDGRVAQWTQFEGVELNAGTVTSLDNPRFSPEEAAIGLWQPFQFIQSNGAGVYFLAPYAANLEPVLFIHGIDDSPRTFSYLIEQLDHTRYQAWVASYPSGWRLPDLAAGFYNLMAEMHERYHFKRLHLVAHSMGGLVTRGFINECARRHSCDYLRTFTTISTPWGGHTAAQLGVKYAPTVVPVWRDMTPESEYLQSLFATPLPADLPHYLLFSYRRTDSIGSENDDGSVTLASELRPEAQAEARAIAGYDENHTSILRSALVAQRLKEILASRR